MKAKLPLRREYVEFVTELKQRIASARLHAARAVNRDLILLYWDIGRGILERQEKLGWGQSVVEMLAHDLQRAFPGISGYSARNLWDMRRFYSVYSDPLFLQQSVAVFGKLDRSTKLPRLVADIDTGAAQVTPPEFLRQAVAEIPWGHHLQILNKVEAPAARLFYLRATSKLGWSRNVLLNQIKARAYERSLGKGKTHNFPKALPEYLAEQAEHPRGFAPRSSPLDGKSGRNTRSEQRSVFSPITETLKMRRRGTNINARRQRGVGVLMILMVACWLEATVSLATAESLPKIKPAPEFTLTKQDGKRLTLEELRGKVLAITFIFASCADTCPLLTAKMAGIQNRLGSDFGPKVHFVSITVDAQRDTPEVLKRYAEAYKADPAGWAFLTGTPAEIRAVAKRYGIYYKKTSRGDVDHTFLTSRVDQNGILRVQYMGVKFNPDEILGDIQSLVKENKAR